MVDHMANSSAYILSSRHHVFYLGIHVPLDLQTQLKQTDASSEGWLARGFEIVKDRTTKP